MNPRGCNLSVWLAGLALLTVSVHGCRTVRDSQPEESSAQGQLPAASTSADALAPPVEPKDDATDSARDSEVTSDAPTTAPETPSVHALFRPRAGPVAPSAKIFLVAASSANANFAQEVVDQRRLWRDAGFADDEIACYYTVPYQEELEADREQFLALAPELASCYPASVQLLFAHLSATADGPFLYLYVTAHGERPISRRLAEAQPGDDGYHELVRRSQHAVLDQYRVVFESLPDGTARQTEILGAYRAGVNPRALYFTPKHLAEVLSARAPTQPKFVVLQACFSGGFVADPRTPSAAPGITGVPGITVLTAARHDRESFGCGHDERHTYYGGAFNEALARALASPLRVEWRTVHRAVSARVAALEAELDAAPSEPVFFASER